MGTYMRGGGKRLRQATAEAKRKSKSSYKCPGCSRVSVKREASGVWKCKKCSAVFASAAYEFRG